jgi:2-polyprenyl-3-methyl-5-hydroxy-6-metoxy-1,4-benzoquinol methylase
MGFRAKLRSRLGMPSAKSTFDAARYWNDRYSKHGDALSGPGCLGLSETENEHDYAVKAEFITSAIAASFGEISSLSILDAGCGRGVLAEILVNAGARVTGVDFSPDAINRARSRIKNAQFQVAELDALPFDRQYDVVLSIDVLYHVVDDSKWNAAIAGMLRACKRGGGVLIQEALDLKDTGEHVRWRTFSDYVEIAAACHSSIEILKQYRQPAEPVVKSILLMKPFG